VGLSEEDSMKARQLIAGATYDPDTLKIIFKAFDDAWAEAKPSVSSRAIAVEAARLSLANIILSLAQEDSRDPDQLKNEAVRIFQFRREIST
jgi:hypothetical protein